MMHSGTTDFLKLASVFIFVGLAVWWLESRFDSLVAVIVVGGLFGVIFFAGGALLSHMIAKSTMQNITKFADRDAQTDRFRMQSFKALAQGESAMQRAAAQLTVLDARRVDQIAAQRAKLLTDGIERQPQPDNDVWTWDEDQPAESGATFQVWE